MDKRAETGRASPAESNRELRRHIACVLLGFFGADFGTLSWLTHKYISTRPTSPDPALGLVHPLNDHGSYYYLSAKESASVTLAFWSGWQAVMLVFVVVPKDVIIPPRNTPRWIARVSASFKTGLEELKLAYFISASLSLLFFVATIVLFGTDFARFAIRYGAAAG